MEALEHYCLYDLGYKGYKHTWCNRWNNPNIVRLVVRYPCGSSKGEIGRLELELD